MKINIKRVNQSNKHQERKNGERQLLITLISNNYNIFDNFDQLHSEIFCYRKQSFMELIAALSQSQQLISDLTLRQLNTVHTLMPYFLNIHFNIILTNMLRSLKKSPPLIFPNQNLSAHPISPYMLL